ncbi:MAG TPA: ferritin-like domain-containing protein [Acidimicrobiia bacterium]|jgi:ferritin-like protein|nr:ferritin-like domain-containing protein [Acidimicrobiia bacterium]
MADHTGLHEPAAELSPATVDRHRAIVSLMEELEAVDWYEQRFDASTNEELAAVMAHNRDEEREHAAMLLEWLRRNDPRWDRVFRTYLFTDAPITELEHEDAEGAAARGGAEPVDLGLGNLAGRIRR